MSCASVISSAGDGARTSSLGAEHPWIAVSLYGYGGVLNDMNRHQEAIATLTRSIEIFDRWDRRDSHEADNARSVLSQAYGAAEQYAAALAVTEQIVNRARSRRGTESVAYERALYSHGFYLRRADRAAEAIPLLRESLSIAQRVEPHDAAAHTTVRLALADALCAKAPNAEGKTLAGLALEVRKVSGVEWQLGIARSVLGYCDPDAGAFAHNENELLQAVAQVGATRGDGSPQTRDVVKRVVRFYEFWKRSASATRWRASLQTRYRIETTAP